MSEPMKVSEGSITANEGGGVTFTQDATLIFAASALKSGMKLLAKGIKPNRGWNKTKCLLMARKYTGKVYGRADYDRAIADLEVWIAESRKNLVVPA